LEITDKKTEQRIPHLDGLRGFLALTIFVYHFIYCFSPYFITGGVSIEQLLSGRTTIYSVFAFTPLNLLYNSGLAVDFFFVLSGYVLSFTYFLKQDLQIIQQNTIKRYFRLAIPVLALCLLVWICHRLNLIYRDPIPRNDFNSGWLQGLMPDYLSFLEVLRFSLLNVFGGDSRYCSVLWTMHIELVGSLLVFVVLLTTHKISSKRKKLTVFILFFIINVFWNDILYSSFILGMIICFLQINSKKYLAVAGSAYTKIFLLLTGLYLASFPFIKDGTILNKTIYGIIFIKNIANLQEHYYILASCLLLMLILNSEKIKYFFSSKPFTFLGKISFGLYLIHLPLIFVISTRIYRFFYKYFFDAVNIPLTFVISLVCLFAFSWLFYRFIDYYAIKWASQIAKFFWK